MAPYPHPPASKPREFVTDLATAPSTPSTGTLPYALAQALSRRELPALSAVRTFAVMLVISYHGGFVANVPGAHGVTLFFVLSGFLISWLLLRERDRTGTVDVRAFYIRRALRIVPALVVYWLIIVAYLLARGRPVPWGHAFSALGYVSNYYNAILGDPNNGFSHTWSLAVEEQFYLLWPPIFLWLVPRGRLLVALVASVLGLWMLRWVLVLGFDVDQRYVYSAFETRADAILVGCLLAASLYAGKARALWRHLTCHPVLPLVTVVAFMAASLGDHWTGVPRYRDVVSFSLVPVLAAVLIVQWMSVATHPAWRWLEARPIRYLGTLSYSLYLYQQLTLYAVSSRTTELPHALSSTLALAVTIVVAAISYHAVERPFLRLKEQFVRTERRTVAPRELLVAEVFTSVAPARETVEVA